MLPFLRGVRAGPTFYESLAQSRHGGVHDSGTAVAQLSRRDKRERSGLRQMRKDEGARRGPHLRNRSVHLQELRVGDKGSLGWKRSKELSIVQEITSLDGTVRPQRLRRALTRQCDSCTARQTLSRLTSLRSLIVLRIRAARVRLLVGETR